MCSQGSQLQPGHAERCSALRVALPQPEAGQGAAHYMAARATCGAPHQRMHRCSRGWALMRAARGREEVLVCAKKVHTLQPSPERGASWRPRAGMAAWRCGTCASWGRERRLLPPPRALTRARAPALPSNGVRCAPTRNPNPVFLAPSSPRILDHLKRYGERTACH